MPDWVTFAGLVTLLVAFIAAVAKISRWSGQVDADRKNLKESAATDRSTLKEFMEEIRSDIKKILLALPPPRTAARARPAQLTEFGQEVAARVDAHAWAVRESQSILADATLIEMEPYQIEAFCGRHVTDQSRKQAPVQEKVQRAIYEFGIDMERALPVLRIPLRNALLSRREELQASS